MCGAAAERAALTALFDQYADSVRGYAVSMVGSHAADDIVSETFLVAWRRRADVPEVTLPWLLATARRIAGTHTRGERRRWRLAARLRAMDSRPPAGPDPAGDPLARELEEELQRALAQLSAVEREALILTSWLDLGHDEAARVQGTSTSTFAVRLHRARKRARAALAAGATTESAQKGSTQKGSIQRGRP